MFASARPEFHRKWHAAQVDFGGEPQPHRSRRSEPGRPRAIDQPMTPLFKKLNLGTTQRIHVLSAPASFEAALAALAGVEVQRRVNNEVGFAIAFVTTLAEVEDATRQLVRHAAEDAVLWMAYPKASSKRYRCEFNRDTGWAALGAAGHEPVRMVAIDADWSALRFRKAEHIRRMMRNPEGAISSAGKKKAAAQRKA